MSKEDAISRNELLKAIDTWDKFGVDDTNSLFRLDNLSLPLDENKENNIANNLEWCTRQYNNNYGRRNEKISITQKQNAYRKRMAILNDILDKYR
jgi:hypothetical protein